MRTRRRTFILFCPVTVALSVDMLISSFSDVFFQQFILDHVYGLVILFIATTAIIYAGGQSILTDFVRKISAELCHKSRDTNFMFDSFSITIRNNPHHI
jgi:hypothetical protein